MHNFVKWPNIFQKSCGVHTARLLKHVWPFYNMHERVKRTRKVTDMELGYFAPLSRLRTLYFADFCIPQEI